MSKQRDPERALTKATVKGIRSAPEGQRAEFGTTMMGIIARFGSIRERIQGEMGKLREDWQKAKGLAAWTEERLEILEVRLDRIERHLGLSPDPEVERMRATLANYRPSTEALGTDGKGLVGDPATFGRVDPVRIAAQLGVSERTVRAALAKDEGYEMSASMRAAVEAEAAVNAPRVGLHRRSGVFYAQLWSEAGGKFLTARSTGETSRTEALRVVARWLADGWGGRKVRAASSP